MTIHVLRTPMRPDRTEPSESRWCFGCRKRLRGTWTFWIFDGDPMDDWYGPHWSFTCDGCGEDRRLGFGMEWEA